jgi:hypothetical protein
MLSVGLRVFNSSPSKFKYGINAKKVFSTSLKSSSNIQFNHSSYDIIDKTFIDEYGIIDN